jgi:outer membrane protein assembly factor BamA/transposase
VKAVFGATRLEGQQTVGDDVILRELAYKAREPFSQRKLDESRDRILALDLFALVNIKPELDTRNPRVAPIRLIVKEKPKHAIAIGGGYNTQSQFIADFEWTDRNWLGGGRQLSLLAQYSNIDSTLAANLRQPFLFKSPRTTGLLSDREDIQQVPTYTLFGTRLIPRLEYKFELPITVSVGYQLEYDSLSDVDPSVPRALGGIKQSGIVSGPNARLVVNTTNDPYNPSSGQVLTIDAMEGGGIFGGAHDFYRVVTEIKDYYLIGWGTILATRAKLGIADSIGSQRNYPLFYRFYAGGEGSVRGYPYLRLGPKSADNVPLGGLTWIEESVELRHKIWKQLDGAAFLDFGQLSTDAYHIPIDNLRFGAGPALSYEMLRAHVVDGLRVTEAAAIHGYSRPAYYLVADSFAEAGMMGLLDERRGRRRPLKLSAEILAFIRSADPNWSSATLAQAIMRRFAVSLHRRTVERARQR